MQNEKWEMYLSICRKIESGGRNCDWSGDNDEIVRMHGEFVDVFQKHLPPPARILVPGGMSEALILAERGYEVHTLLLGPDNVSLIRKKAQERGLSNVYAYELDAHDLPFEEGYFDGYLSVQFHEHLIAPMMHLGEAWFVLRRGAVVFVDACGTTNDACKMVWHTNLVPEKTVLEQWEFWGFEELWRGPYGDDRPQFVFRSRGLDDPAFTNAGYLKWIVRLRRGERIEYAYNSPHT